MPPTAVRVAYIYWQCEPYTVITHHSMNAVYTAMNGVNDAALRLPAVCDYYFVNTRTRIPPPSEFNRRYRGVIIHSNLSRTRRFVRSLTIPFVCIGSDLDDADNNAVRLDNNAAMETMLDHLVHKGFTRIGWINPFPSGWAIERDRAFTAAHARHFNAPSRWYFDARVCARTIKSTSVLSDGSWYVYDDEERARSLRPLMKTLYRTPLPEVFVCVNDNIAALCLAEAYRRGIKIPETLTFTGIDDFGEDIRHFGSGFLTSIRQEYREIGNLALQLLSEIIAGERPPRRQHIFTPPRLIARSSTARDTMKPRERFLRNDIAAYIDRNIAEPAMHVSLARHVRLTPAYLSAKFKQLFGMTLKRYVSTARLTRAAFLIARTKRPITDILLDVGYSDSSTFAMQFKKQFSCRPSAYRSISSRKNS